MAHRAMIDSTAYDIYGGRTLVGGTAYSVTGGRTLADGTAYGISFASGKHMVYLTGSGGEDTVYAVIGGVTYTGSAEVEAAHGEEIEAWSFSRGGKGGVYLDGERISEAGGDGWHLTFVPVEGDLMVEFTWRELPSDSDGVWLWTV